MNSHQIGHRAFYHSWQQATTVLSLAELRNNQTSKLIIRYVVRFVCSTSGLWYFLFRALFFFAQPKLDTAMTCLCLFVHLSLQSYSFCQAIFSDLDETLQKVTWYNWSTNLKHTTVLMNYWLKWCDKLSIFPCNSSSLTLNDSNLLSVE